MYTKENTKKTPEIYFSLELRIENHIRGKLSLTLRSFVYLINKNNQIGQNTKKADVSI